MRSGSGSGVVLKWQRVVIGHLTRHRPSNHSSVAALAAVLVTHADPDGSSVYPSQATMSSEAGLHHTTVSLAIQYLKEAGFIVHVRNRAKGLREYRFQIADEPNSGLQISGQIAGQIADDPRQPPYTSVDLQQQPPQIADEPNSEAFALFTLERAGAEIDRRIGNGTSIRNRNAYAAKVAVTPDFIEESHHVWQHRFCGECAGKGYLLFYPQAGGTTSSRCRAKPEIEAEASW